MSTIEEEIDKKIKVPDLYDVKRNFIMKNREIIKCEPSGMSLNDLEHTKVTRMRWVD